MLKQNFEKPCKSIQIAADAYRSEKTSFKECIKIDEHY
jgi:hypothetical protein